jgi:hypothetical protein
MLDKIAQCVLNIFQLVLFFVMLCCFLLSILLLIANVTQGGYNLIFSLLCDTHSANVISKTLHLLEGLLLSPMPFIISAQIYELSIALRGETSEEAQKGLVSFTEAKSLMISLMISIIGVNLVDKLLEREASFSYYAGGAVTMVALIGFYALLTREGSHSKEKS